MGYVLQSGEITPKRIHYYYYGYYYNKGQFLVCIKGVWVSFFLFSTAALDADWDRKCRNAIERYVHM